MQPLADDRAGLGALPRRPLYLATRAKLRVHAEGESLVVTRAPGGCQRFPAARIDRVICGSGADWSGVALALCLRHGITVTWLAASGDAIGHCSPRLAHTRAFHDAVESYVESPEWSFAYRNWLRRERMGVLIRWARQRLAAGKTVEPAAWEACKREFVFKGLVSRPLDPELHAWCRAAVVARLAKAGLRARYFGYDGEPLELAEDLTALIWADLAFGCGDLLAGTFAPDALPMAFEAGAEDRERRLREHLGRLRVHVLRVLDAWL